ncbi:5'-methylthioadenosine/S-adenosylhomocysteine nucleosidase family protein [Aspergillus alliaceus]|uniref:5'-methylthioadenosine/S-adenosylhomocysteine nucleosidase family protein n=1 Tax=Petromyces alliaceus TaxID=209559 RepID=UPI0012A64C92|nr:nucleoside phosphorylase domain-containing protein [Aspergillus alliaceus]KAB8236420.1 nucleoside phosphorylase domain-containing protein [Aspergillus alliaceus]
MGQMKNRRLEREEYAIGWVCLLETEHAAARVMLDEEYDSYELDGPCSNLYTLGRCGEHNIVIACPPPGQSGHPSAAAVAAHMISTFMSIQFTLMVGIGAGVPTSRTDIRLGDVVVSQPNRKNGGVMQFDLREWPSDEVNHIGFIRTPPRILQDALSILRADRLGLSSTSLESAYRLREWPMFRRENAGPDLLFEADYSHVGGPNCRMCSRARLVEREPRRERVAIHHGIIASCDRVIKDAIWRDRLSSQLGGVICFESEAYGLMNMFPCLFIRGVCDYADSHTSHAWQAYAAGSAAVYAKELLSVISSVDEKSL